VSPGRPRHARKLPPLGLWLRHPHRNSGHRRRHPGGVFAEPSRGGAAKRPRQPRHRCGLSGAVPGRVPRGDAAFRRLPAPGRGARRGRRRRRALTGDRAGGPGLAADGRAQAGALARERRRTGGCMSMRVGTAPITWGICEIPGWGPQLPYGQVLDEMAKAGYEGTELGPAGYLPQDAGRLREELAQRGLAMIAAFVPVNFRERAAHRASLAAVEEVARLLAASGAGHILLSDEGDELRRAIAGRAEETAVRGMTAEQWQAFVDGLHEASDRCRDLGLTVSFHPHG